MTSVSAMYLSGILPPEEYASSVRRDYSKNLGEFL